MTYTSETKMRPILFSAPMVKAIFAGAKTQTRRVVRPQFHQLWGYGVGIGRDTFAAHVDITDSKGQWRWLQCPFGKPGDHLWVRESFHVVNGAQRWKDGTILYRADVGENVGGVYVDCAKWKPSIHMPRWASRITLEVVEVRIQRLQEITPADAIAEGAVEWGTRESIRRNFNESGHRRETPIGSNVFDGTKRNVPYLVNAFVELWDSINERRGHGWTVNPWVWVVTFKQVKS